MDIIAPSKSMKGFISVMGVVLPEQFAVSAMARATRPLPRWHQALILGRLLGAIMEQDREARNVLIDPWGPVTPKKVETLIKRAAEGCDKNKGGQYDAGAVYHELKNIYAEVKDILFTQRLEGPNKMLYAKGLTRMAFAFMESMEEPDVHDKVYNLYGTNPFLRIRVANEVLNDIFYTARVVDKTQFFGVPSYAGIIEAFPFDYDPHNETASSFVNQVCSSMDGFRSFLEGLIDKITIGQSPYKFKNEEDPISLNCLYMYLLPFQKKVDFQVARHASPAEVLQGPRYYEAWSPGS